MSSDIKDSYLMILKTSFSKQEVDMNPDLDEYIRVKLEMTRELALQCMLEAGWITKELYETCTSNRPN